VRLLVVDDDPDAGALVESALIDAHFERAIEVVSTATAGIERIRADEHDAYVIDHRLPDGTGIGLIHEAKAAGIDKPFILITGYGSGALDEAALHEGAADYVEKHLLSTYLERSIRYALRDWQTNRALREREEQLRHAQKMEGIGRLAGGVAHDFNNLLTAIIGFTDLIIERIDPLDSTADDVREIRKAADRAAALTRQLLAFSRRQLLDPRVLDLNETVTGLIRMLPRVIGEHIETSTRLAPHLGRVWADPSQMDQMLMNLILNARDAMPGGGRGLATVYGIVDQSGGAIALESAPGRGTSVRVSLPVASALSRQQARGESPAQAAGGGTETLLVVDDDDSVRHVTAEALRRRGYTIHEARNAEEAIRWSTNAPAKPDLLLTDIVMPAMNGLELASRLMRDNPGMRVLYVSGYTDEVIDMSGNRWRGAPLLQKPFTLAQLAERVRLALEPAGGA